MRTLAIAAVAAALTFGGSAADAQRLGAGGAPAGGWRGGTPPQTQPMPRPNPGQWQGPRPGNPGGWNGPRPGNPGNWNNGGWNNGGQRRTGWISNRSRWGNRVGGYWWAGVQAPGGWNGYTRVKRGKRVPNYWLSANFAIGDWQLYGLMAPPAGYYWTRYYNDALLVDRYGVVYDGAYDIDWDRYDDGYAYDDSYGYGEPAPLPAYGAGYPAPGYGASGGYDYRSERYAEIPPPPAVPNLTYRAGYAGTYYTPPGTTTTIVVPGATTTTTTTEYITETYAPRPVVRKVYRAPVRKWRPKVRVQCTCSCGCR